MSTSTRPTWVPTDTLAARLKIVRAELGLGQREAAELCGLHFGEWQGMESGRKARELDRKVRAISKTFDVDPVWLMFGGPLRDPDSDPRSPVQVPTRRSVTHRKSTARHGVLRKTRRFLSLVA